jgi:HEPN domain-containing protein
MSQKEDFQRWIEYAEADRRAAEHLFESGDYSICAELCQQMLEKIIKAVIVARTGERPAYEHNLKKLADEIPGIPDSIVEILLNVGPHYRMARYPGFAELDMYDEDMAHETLDSALEAFQWFFQQIK